MSKRDVFHSVLVTLLNQGIGMSQALKEAQTAVDAWEKN